MLLFTPENLRFSPMGNLESVGDLQMPKENFLIIDGQHLLAALEFYLRDHPDDARIINLLYVIFDGGTDDFAAEMFVIINSTTTRINRSHLVDLYERVSWATREASMSGSRPRGRWGATDGFIGSCGGEGCRGLRALALSRPARFCGVSARFSTDGTHEHEHSG